MSKTVADDLSYKAGVHRRRFQEIGIKCMLVYTGPKPNPRI